MDFTLIGVPYDKTQTFRKGASKAPEMIRGIFDKLETFIDGVDLTEHFVEDLGDVSKEQISDLQIKGFPIILGGEHTITEWMVDRLKPENVVVFDAHPDCEDSEGHDGVIRRLAEKGYNVYIIAYGLRTVSRQEREYLSAGKVRVIDALELANLEGDTYISIDLDVLDPSIMPAVGNPEPSGMKFADILVNIDDMDKSSIIGIDFVEYTPTEKDNDIYLSIVGKLIYSLMARITRRKQ